MSHESPKPSGLGPQDLHPDEIGDGCFFLGVGGAMGAPGWLCRLHDIWDVYHDPLLQASFEGLSPRERWRRASTIEREHVRCLVEQAERAAGWDPSP